MSTCPNCNKQLEEGVKICDACGTEIAEAVETGERDNIQANAVFEPDTESFEAEAEPVAKSNLPKLPFELNKKILAFGAAALAIILVLAIVVSALFTGGEPNYALYMKEGELMYYGMSGDPWQVSDDMDGNSSALNLVSKDGKKIFFIQDGDLYVRNVESKKDAEKLGTEVESYMISEDGKRVLFETEDGNIYTHNLKERKKIDSEIDSVVGFSKDLKKVIYTKDAGSEDNENAKDIYLYNGKEPVKLESGVAEVTANDDVSVVYYIKNDDLYSKKGTKEGKKIAEDISDIDAVYSDGSIYYTKTEQVKNEEYGFNQEKKSLYYYNGKKETLVVDEYSKIEDGSDETPVLIYAVDVTEKDAVEQEFDYFVAIKEASTAIDDGVGFKLTPDGKSIYYYHSFEDEDSDSSTLIRDLYKINISGKKVGKSEKYDTDIFMNRGISIAENGTVFYFKDYKDNKATLYKDKKEVASDVYVSSLNYSAASDTVVYYVDYKTEDKGSSGTLYFSKNGKKPVKVDEEVYRFVFTPDGQIVYLKDRNGKNGEGDLYVNKLTKKSKKIDEDVSGLSRVYSWAELEKAF